VSAKPTSARLATRLSFRTLLFLTGCSALTWGLANFTWEASGDDFRALEDRLLQFETFDGAVGVRRLESPATKELSPCDSHAQRALLLLEIPLAETALRSGAVRDFDRHLQSLQDRATQVLACSPRDSLAWLLLFGLQVEQGRLDKRSFDLLDASYDTSPNEAWVSARRLSVALPVILEAPEPIQKKIINEFKGLIRERFLDVPVHAFLAASGPSHALLQSIVGELDPSSQKAFSEALDRARL
jgi:hypothetical protein